jgi:hydroxymethylpyrimidine pyrophosphatase-like HAD family hydrolase
MSENKDILEHEPKKAFVFDLDGTLFTTTAVERKEFMHPDCWVEFRDSEKLLIESTPLPLLSLARQVKEEGHTVFVLTARGNAIAGTIRMLLQRYGVDVTFVYCVGDKGIDIPVYKAEILAGIGRRFDKTYFYDNEVENFQYVSEYHGVHIYDENGKRFK